MALNSGKILMRRGQEVNFDPNKMTPGEWAVSLDSKYVRMCFSPGACVRIATYDAFEADMEQIRQILSQCQTIEEAVTRINNEISVKEEAVAEYTEQAKQYRDEAEQFKNQAFSSTPEGYLQLVEQVEENTRRIEEGGGDETSGTLDYEELENKPSINNIELSGNKTLQDLGIKPHALSEPTNNLLATEPGTPLDAVQGKVLYDRDIDMCVGRLPMQAKNKFATIEEFVQETANNINIPVITRIQDTTGAWGPGGKTQWYKCLVVYQNPYGSNYSLGGSGFMWDDAGNKWSITITGNSHNAINFKHEKLVTETEINDFNNGLTSIKVHSNTDFITVANSVPTNKKLTCRMLGSGGSPVTGLPANQLYIVEIYAISEATAIATAYAAESGNMYVNRKSSGNWQGWVKKTDTIS